MERYNKEIKSHLGNKRNCNWVVFLNFINDEIIRIDTKLAKNENINIEFIEKNTKFGKEKFCNNILAIKDTKNNFDEVDKSISNGWLKKKT